MNPPSPTKRFFKKKTIQQIKLEEHGASQEQMNPPSPTKRLYHIEDNPSK
jgi:hypothetical protein